MGLRYINGLVFSFILIFASIAQAANYYVSPTGNDSNDGSAVDDAHAWLTPQHAADTVTAGDTVYFLSGTYDGFRVNLVSGTEENRITFKNYNGSQPIFHRLLAFGADSAILPIGTTWTNISGNKWHSPTNSVMNSGYGVMRNHSVWFAKSLASSNITAHGDNPWFYYDSTNHRVEVNSTTDPSLDDWVVTDVDAYSIFLRGSNYIIIDGLITEYGSAGIFASLGSSHNIFRNNVTRYSSRRGISIQGTVANPTTDNLIENNVMHTNADHGFKSVCDVCNSGEIVDTYFTLRGNVSYNNGYDGYQISNGCQYFTVENNIAYDNGINPCGQVLTGSEGCASFAANISNGVAQDVTWINNIAYSTGTRTYYATDVPTLIRPGFVIFSTSNALVSGNHFYNNEGPGIYGTQGSVVGSGNVIINNLLVNNENYDAQISTLDNTKFYNNTLSGGTLGGIYIGAGALLNEFKNNVVISPTASNLLTFTSGSTSTLDYNAWYSPDATPFSYAGSSYNFTDYKSASSQDANSLNTDFTSDFIDYSGGNYAIKSTATVKDLGTSLPSVLDDYRGVRRPKGSGYAIGAYEEGNSITFKGLTYD